MKNNRTNSRRISTEGEKADSSLRYLLESDPEHLWPTDEIGTILGFNGKRRSRLVKMLKGLVAEGFATERKPGFFMLAKAGECLPVLIV